MNEVVDSIKTWPYEKGNSDGQCITHTGPVKGVHIKSDGIFTDDYCIYLFYDDASCGGDVSDRSSALGHSFSKLLSLYSCRYVVIRVDLL